MKARLLIRLAAAGARRLLPTFVALAVLFFPVPAFAHELRPAYLQLQEERPGEFSVFWKTPMLGDARLALEPEFSGDAKAITPVTTRSPLGAAIQQWTLRASNVARTNPAHPWTGKHHDGRTRTDGVRRWHGVDEAPDTARAIGGDPQDRHRGWRPRTLYIEARRRAHSDWEWTICCSCWR